MDIKQITEAAGDTRCREVLEYFLREYTTPAFGALPKTEVELLVLEALIQIGAVSDKPALYELVTKLKITRAKARRLVYDRELRRRTEEDLDREVREVLAHPLIEKRGEVFALEVENPLVCDHLRARLQKLNHLTDGSFSPGIITLKLDAMTALIEALLEKHEQDKVKKALVKAGAADTSFRGVLKGVLKRLGEKIADEAGAALVGQVSDYLTPIITGATKDIAQQFEKLLTSGEHAGHSTSSAGVL